MVLWGQLTTKSWNKFAKMLRCILTESDDRLTVSEWSCSNVVKSRVLIGRHVITWLNAGFWLALVASSQVSVREADSFCCFPLLSSYDRHFCVKKDETHEVIGTKGTPCFIKESADSSTSKIGYSMMHDVKNYTMMKQNIYLILKKSLISFYIMFFYSYSHMKILSVPCCFLLPINDYDVTCNWDWTILNEPHAHEIMQLF